MTRPLDELDERLLQYRGVARRAAGQLKRRFPRCEVEDLEAVCWAGVAGGLAAFDPARGDLIPYLCVTATRRGAAWAARRQLRDIPAVPITPGVERRLGAVPGPERWSEEDWAAALAPLPDYQRRVVELRLREGMTFAAVAAATGFSASKACRVFREAVEALKREGS